MIPSPPARPQLDHAQILSAVAPLGVLGAGVGSAPRMMAMLCDPLVSAGEIISLLEKQPGLCARVLRVANSPYYGQTRSVTTVKHAFLLLGFDAVRSIAAAACLDRTMSRGSNATPMDMRALMHHSLATAIAAELLAQIHCRPLAAEAFIAGLLHNLGVAVQIHIDAPGINAMINALRNDTERGIRVLESQHASVRHEECAVVIFDAWQLPHALVSAVGHHHDPMAAPEAHRKLAALVNLGASLGLACGHTFTLEPVPVRFDVRATNQIGVTEEDLDGVAAKLPQRVDELRRALFDG